MYLNCDLNKIQYPVIIKKKKKLQKIVIEGTYHSIIKVIYDKSTTNIILNGENLKAFSLRLVTRQWCTLPALLFNMEILEVLVLAMRKEKETKDLYFENYKTLMKKSMMTQTDGEIYYVFELEESMLSNEHIIQINLQIQCNLYQIINGIFHKLEQQKNHKAFVETQKTE